MLIPSFEKTKAPTVQRPFSAWLKTLLAVSFLALAFGAGIPGSAQAAPDRVIPFTARLRLSDGSATVPDGNYQVTFSLYTVETGGTPVWSEQQSVAMSAGVMRTFLGSATPFPASLNFNDGDYYLGVRVGSDNEMTPRRRVGAVPVALNAETVSGSKPGSGAGDVLLLNSAGNIVINGSADLSQGLQVGGSITASQSNVDIGSPSSPFSHLYVSDLSSTTVSGSWQGAAVGVQYGGTGLSSVTAGDLIYASADNTLASLPLGQGGQCLTVTGGRPAWGSCFGGQGGGLTLQSAYDGGDGSLVTGNAKNLAITLADTATDSNFTVNIASGSTGKFAVQSSGSDVLRVTAAGASVLVGGIDNNNGGIVNVGSLSGATTGSFSGLVSVGDLSASGTVSGVWQGTAVAVLYGGTGSTTASGARSNLGAAASGTNGDITSLTGLATAVPVGEGGTGLSSAAANGVLYGNGTAALQATVAGTSGQLLVAGPTGTPSFVSLSGEASLSSAGLLTLNSTGVTAATYGSSSQSAVLTVDSRGRITAASNQPIAAVSSLQAGSGTTVSNSLGTFTISATGSGGTVTSIAAGSGLTGGTITGSGTIAVDPTVVATLAADNAFTGADSFANGLTVSSGSVALPAASVANAALQGSGALTVTAGTGLSGGGSVALGGSVSLSNAGVTLLTAGTGINLSGSSGSVTVSLPQSVASSASPTFAGLSVTGAAGISTGVSSSQNGSVVFRNASNSFTTTVLAGVPGSSISLTLPVTSGSNGDCLLSDGSGHLSFGGCTGGAGGGVTSVNGLSGTISVANATTGGSVITLNNASAVAKGIASFSSADFSVASGAVSLNTAGAPTFAGLTLSNASTGGILSLNNPSNANLTTLQAGTPSGSLSFTLPSTAGQNGQCLQTNGSGVLSFAGCTGGVGGGVTSLDTQAGVLSLANSSGAGGVVTIDNASTSAKGIASFNSTNFTVTSGAVNVVQNIATTSSPTFAGLTLTSALGVGNGGTGGTSFTSNGVLYGNAAGALQASLAGTGGQILLANGSGVPGFASLSGDIASIGATGSVTIAGLAITNGKIADATITGAKLASNISISTSGNLAATGSGTITSAGLLTASNGLAVSTGSTSLGGALTVTTGGAAITGAISSTSTITGTVLNGTTGINTGASTGTQRIDSSGNLVNIGNITGSGAVSLQATAGTLSLASTGANAIAFSVNGAQAAEFNASGYLGIGTATPQTALSLSSAGAFSQEMAPPTVPSAVAAAGGSLPAATYYYEVTASDGNGQTLPSAETAGCVSDGATNQTCTVSWTAPAGAVSYKVYRTSSSGSYGASSLLAIVTGAASYSDSGTASLSAGAPPSVTTSFVSLVNPSGNTYFNGGNLGIGTGTPDAQLTVAGKIPTQIGSTTAHPGNGYVALQGRYAYVVTQNRLTIYDVSVPSSIGTVSTTTIANNQVRKGIKVQGNYAYIPDGNNPGLNKVLIYNISNPVAPVLVSTLSSCSSTLQNIVIQGNYLICSQDTSGVIIYSIADPANPVLLSSASSSIYSYGLAVNGRYAYRLNTQNGSNYYLQVFDISSPKNMVTVSTTLLGAYGTLGGDVVARGSFVYAAYGSTLKIINVSNPASPSVVSTVSLKASSSTIEMSLAGKYLYVANTAGQGVQVFDVSSPTAPVQASNLTLNSTPTDIAVQGRYAYLVQSTGFYAYDLGGAYIQQLEAGAIETGELAVRGPMVAGGSLSVVGGGTFGGSLTALSLGVNGGSAFDGSTLTVASNSATQLALDQSGQLVQSPWGFSSVQQTTTAETSFTDATSSSASTTPFALFKNAGAIADRTYFGYYPSPFKGMNVSFSGGTAGVLGSSPATVLTWEACTAVNASNSCTTWTAISGGSDSTSSLTASGNVTWTTTPVQALVNGVLGYWLRATVSAKAYATAPVATLQLSNPGSNAAVADLIQPSSQAASSNWSSNGTMLGINAPSSFIGNLIDLQTGGSSKFSIDASGNMVIGGTFSSGSTSGTSGYWARSGATLQPATAGDAITTSGNISTTGAGAISSAGLVSISGTGANELAVTGTPAASATSSLVQLGGSSIASGSLAGTYLGINPGSFTGNFADFQVNGSSQFSISSAGAVVATTSISAPTVAGSTSFQGNVTVKSTTNNTPVNDQQTITFSSVNGSASIVVPSSKLGAGGTISVGPGDTASTVQSKLQALGAIGSGNASVSGSITSTVSYYSYIPNGSQLLVYDMSNTSLLATITAGSGAEHALTSADGSRVYVMNNSAGTVSVVNTSTRTVTATVTVGTGPDFGVLSADGTKLFVSNFNGNSVSVIDTGSLTVVQTISTGASTKPAGMAIGGSGRTTLYVALSGTAQIATYNTGTYAAGTVIGYGTNPTFLAGNSTGTYVYGTNLNNSNGNGNIFKIDTSNNSVSSIWSGGFITKAVAISSDDATLFIPDYGNNRILSISTTGTVLHTVATTGQAISMTPSTDGSKVVVNYWASTSKVVTVDTSTLTNETSVVTSTNSDGASVSPSITSSTGSFVVDFQSGLAGVAMSPMTTATSGASITHNRTGAMPLGNVYLNDTNTLVDSLGQLQIKSVPQYSATSSVLALGSSLSGGSANGTYLGMNAPSYFTGNLADLQVNNSSKFKLDYSGNLTLSGTPAASATSSLVQLGGTAIASGSSAGTYLGINPGSFTGNFMDYQVGGSSKFKVDASGNLTISGGITASSTGTVGYLSRSGTILTPANSGDTIAPAAAPSLAATTQTITSYDTNASSSGKYPKVAMGRDGFPIIAYTNDAGGSYIKVLHCTTASCSTGAITQTNLNNDSQTVTDTAIAIGSDGFPVVGWNETGNSKVYLVHCTNASCSTTDTVSTISTGVSVSNQIALAIGSDGFPLMAFMDSTNNQFKVVKCSTLTCASGLTTTAAVTGASVGLYPSIAISKDGLPILSYAGSTTTLKIAKCTTLSCSSSTQTDAVTSASGLVGTSIAIGTDGLPLVSYEEGGTLNVKILHCANAACTDTGSQTVSAFGAAGTPAYTSLAIGKDGLPVASYYTSGSQLGVIRCGDSKCVSTTAGGFTASVPDGASSIGQYSSLGIGTDGLPFIAYFQQAGSPAYGLKALKCADAGCVNSSAYGWSGGSNLGSAGQFFNSVYAANYYGKQFQLTGFDVAEVYHSKDATLAAGDIVTASADGPASVDKSSSPYQSSSLGIVSTQPGLTLSQWNAQPGDRPIALNGRVPAKVSTENGEIRPGDYIATSSRPGVGMKAVRSGRTVGIALEGYSGSGIGTITVFVSPAFFVPDSTGSQDSTISYADLANKVAALQGESAALQKASAASAVSLNPETLAVKGDASIGGTLAVAGNTAVAANLSVGAPVDPAIRLLVKGGSDQRQLVIQASADQSSDIFQILSSDGSPLFSVNAAGVVKGAAFASNLRSVTGDYLLTDMDSVITADASQKPLVISLPSAAGFSGRQFTVKKTDASPNSVSLRGHEAQPDTGNAPAGETIDGQPTYVLPVRFKYVTVLSDGKDWIVIANN